jgi:hypothetical protein
MSQTSVPQEMSRFDAIRSQAVAQEFAYRPVPLLAPVSLVLGLCSVIALFGTIGLVVSLIGTILGFLTFRKIRAAGGELGGRIPALAGFVLSAFFLVGGSTLQAYEYATEVPEGFARVNFANDISKKGFVSQDGQQGLHPDVMKLDGQKIFLKGYMYPTPQTEGITEFVLVKDNQQCCFGGQPALTDMIVVRLPKNMPAELTSGIVNVAGVFHTKPNQDTVAGLAPVYEIEGAYFKPSRILF